MLRRLRIRNLAVIDAVDVEFEDGFTVLTGETGAGKSILVEAVGLLLGGRSSSDLVRTGESTATIEAVFEDGGADIVVRREVTSQGRSRSFVNGSAATAGVLRDLAARLVELHGQHEHQALLDPDTHLPTLDAYAGLQSAAAAVEAAWTRVSALRQTLERAGMDVKERQARLDLISYQLGEIERVSPTANEDEELAVTQRVLASADRVKRLCEEGYGALYDGDPSVLGLFAQVRRRLVELAGVEPAFAEYLRDADVAKAQMEDLAGFLRQYADRVDASPGRLQEVEDRLASIERLKRKYGPTLDEVLARGLALTAERELLTGDAADVSSIQRDLDQAGVEFLRQARSLSADRRGAAIPFARNLEQLLSELAMGHTRFEVRFNATEPGPAQWGARGIDVAEFFVSPNLGEDLRPLTRIVSGGELSRIMLAVKTLSARRGAAGGAVRTLIFDEVDAGIGGAVADVVGARLQALGDRFQVLCITHLPQIAARGRVQYRIAKTVRAGRTTTSVSRVEAADRIDELARMLGGSEVSDAMRASAAEMVRRAMRVDAQAKGESESPAGGESESRRRPRRNRSLSEAHER